MTTARRRRKTNVVNPNTIVKGREISSAWAWMEIHHEMKIVQTNVSFTQDQQYFAKDQQICCFFCAPTVGAVTDRWKRPFYQHRSHCYKTKRAIFFCWLPFLPYCRPFVEAKGGLGIVEFSLFDLLCPWSIGLRH